jgi:hypothetical protein
VLDALGGVVVVFTLPPPAPASLESQSHSHSPTSDTNRARDLIRHVGTVVRDGLGGWEWDGVGLCLGIGELDEDNIWEWEDAAAEWGLEFVQMRTRSGGGGASDVEERRNEFGGRFHVALFLRVFGI